jgi:hypothetical protein
MEGSIWFRRPARQPRRKAKSQFHNGERRAVKRALTGARIRLGLPVRASSLVSAARQVGSTDPMWRPPSGCCRQKIPRCSRTC